MSNPASIFREHATAVLNASTSCLNKVYHLLAIVLLFQTILAINHLTILVKTYQSLKIPVINVRDDKNQKSII